MNSPWGDDLSDDESDEARLLGRPNRNYQATQEQLVREHEEGLDNLGRTIKNQRYMADEIATEVEVHNEILENIDDGLSKVDANIKKNTRNIRLVTKKSSTFYLWFLIIILAIAIAVLAIL